MVNKQTNTQINRQGSFIKLLITVLISIFVIEYIIMFALKYLPPVSSSAKSVVDAITLTIFSLPVIYLVLLRPLKKLLTERKQTERALLKENAFVKLLKDVAIATNEATSAREAMLVVLERVCTLIEWPIGHVYVRPDIHILKDVIINPGQTKSLAGEIAPTTLWYLKDTDRFEPFRQVTESTSFVVGVELPGRVLSSGKPVWITDVTTDTNFPGTRITEKITVRGAFAIPITVNHEVTVIMEFFSPVKEERDESLLELMTHIGTQLGYVIEREQAKEALRESEEKYRTVVESSPGYIFLIDYKGRILDINPAVGQEELEALTTTKVYDMVNPDDKDIFQENINNCFVNGGIHEFEVGGGGKMFTYQVMLGPVETSEGLADYLVCNMYDITDRKRAEEALKKTAEELARSNAELEQFAYIASHDLQEPLRMVGSYTQLLARRYKDKLDSDANEFIEYAQDGVSRMQILINDLLKYSRVGTQGKPFKPTDCATVLETKLQDLKIAIEKSKAKITYDPLPTVNGDGTQLGQLFQNLIGNAIKFRSVERPEIHVKSESKNGEWLFSVRDNGIGIDPQYKDRVFVIFQRLHTISEYSGTGIGLAVCKKIVERHGGQIWLESEVGKGTVFYFTLPAMNT